MGGGVLSRGVRCSPLSQTCEIVCDQGSGYSAANDHNLAIYIFGKFSMAGNLCAVYKPHRATPFADLSSFCVA
jgi:hypothetical protein